jgi:sec-independent protein translocase protein TatC
MSNDTEHPDPEDMFNDTRMSFGDHLEDLRTHMFRAIKGFVIGMLLGIWPLGSYVLEIIMAPVQDQLYEFEKVKLDKEMVQAKARFDSNAVALPRFTQEVWINKDELLIGLGLQRNEPPVLDTMVRGFESILVKLEVDDLLDEEVRKQGSFIKVKQQIADPLAFSEQMMKMQAQVRRPRLSTMNITESFIVYFKVALLTGLVLSCPWVFYHIWMFIAAGLYPHEKKLVNVYLPFSLVLFIGGVLLCQFAVMPRAVAAMLWFNEWLGLSADLRLNEWLGFALLMPVVFGISFQTPLVMMFLHKVGILTVQTYRDYRRISWFLMAVFAVVIVPSPDAVSMLFLWIPMGGLYELGILLCVWQGEQNTLLGWADEEKSDELVEV